MRGSLNVGETRREAVLKAATELGYRPNELARGLVQRRTHTIGVFPSDPDNPFFAEVVEEIQLEADSVRYRTLLERQPDGMILLSPSITSVELDRVASIIPTVLVGRRTNGSPLDHVVNDDLAGAVTAVEHLAELGHRRIAHVCGGNAPGSA